MTAPPCFICRFPASWRGVVGSTRQYVCHAHKSRIELQATPFPFVSRVFARPSNVRSLRGSSPVPLAGEPRIVSVGVEQPPPGFAPPADSLSGNAA